MTPEQFEDALDRHGAHMGSWPPGLSAAARELMATSARAAAMWRQATEIEAFMRTHDPGLGISPERVSRVAGRVMGRIGGGRAPVAPIRHRRLLSAVRLQVGGVNWVPRLAASVAVGLGFGLMAGSSGFLGGTGFSPLDIFSLSDSYLLLGL